LHAMVTAGVRNADPHAVLPPEGALAPWGGPATLKMLTPTLAA
jgi:hypothetical protein